MNERSRPGARRPRRPGQPSLFETSTAQGVADAFDPARLTQARVLADLNKQALAHELGVSPAAIGQYEAGIIAPRPELLDQMARRLSVPVSFFATGRPNTRLDASMAHFRSLRSTRVGQRTRAIVFAEQLWELAHALELRVELPAIDLPDLGAPGAAHLSPETAARQLRSHWGIGPGPVRHLVRTMETHGVLVTLLPFARTDEIARVDAFSTSRTPRPLVVLTPDRADDVYRHRFTAAHELGHLLLHTEARPGDLEQEQQADRFAAEFLTPATEIKAELPGRLRIPVLEPISRRWGVAVESLVRRTLELGTITEVTARRAYQRIQQLRSVGLLKPEPITAYPGENPTLLRSAFDLAERHGLTVPRLAEELAWKPDLVRVRLGMADTRPTLTLVPGEQEIWGHTANDEAR